MDDLGEIRDSKIISAFGFADATASKIGIGVSRIELDGLGIVRNGLIDVALFPIGAATIVVVLALRLDLERLAEIANRQVDLFFSAVGDAAVAVNVGVMRIDFDRPCEIGDGAAMVAFGAEGSPAIEIWAGIG